MTSASPASDLRVDFQCNLCGGECLGVSRADLLREGASCPRCGSCVRFRTLVHGLSLALLGESLVLDEFPRRRDLHGIGMSDDPSYAKPLRKKLGYRNTFYHRRPRFDVTQPVGRDRFDFVIFSDVFEHVAPPVEQAFRNLFQVLKPGGICVFSVPYRLEGETAEHYPELCDYSVTHEGDDWVLRNRTADGREQEFRDLIFHGGPGETLELRRFTLPDLRRRFEAAGFTSVDVVPNEPRFGLIDLDPRSQTLIVRRP